MNSLEDLKIVLREESIPFFSDEELQYHLKENNGDYRLTAYRCLLLKAENTTLSVSGLTAADSSQYFRRLAAQYRPSNSGVLKGGF